jgi:hypothetical protein
MELVSLTNELVGQFLKSSSDKITAEAFVCGN